MADLREEVQQALSRLREIRVNFTMTEGEAIAVAAGVEVALEAALSAPAGTRFATDDEARDAGQRVIEKHRTLLERLAQHDVESLQAQLDKLPRYKTLAVTLQGQDLTKPAELWVKWSDLASLLARQEQRLKEEKDDTSTRVDRQPESERRLTALENETIRYQTELQRDSDAAVHVPAAPPADPLEEVWRMIEHGWDIESRAEFEERAPKMGFNHPLAMAVHHMHKRCVKENPDFLRAASPAPAVDTDLPPEELDAECHCGRQPDEGPWVFGTRCPNIAHRARSGAQWRTAYIEQFEVAAPALAAPALRRIADNILHDAMPADAFKDAAEHLARFVLSVESVPPAPKPTQWRDITTAPKDGTQVLAWDDERGSNPAMWVDGSWFITYDDAEIKPTHWMHFPDAPQATKRPDWQSMDDAPKGGVSILVKVDGEEQEAVWAPFDGWRTRYSWVSIAPTMWKPMPAPPAPNGEK